MNPRENKTTPEEKLGFSRSDDPSSCPFVFLTTQSGLTPPLRASAKALINRLFTFESSLY